MIGEPDLLFGDVEFLDVEDHLLLQAVVIYLGLQLRQTLPDAGADGFRAGFFERNDLLLVRFDPVDALQKIGDQNCSLLRAELVQMGERLPYGFHYGFMFPVADSFLLRAYHVRQAQDRLDESIVLRAARCADFRLFPTDFQQLVII